jgi:integrating conjugative element protein (TIGR03759 family)
MARKPTAAGLVVLAVGAWLLIALPLRAQTALTTDPQRSQLQHATRATTEADQAEQARADLWGLEPDEWQRYRSLMDGIRGSVSPATLSPIEVLGIHARDAQERRQYAEQWARLMREDAERILAFQHAYDAAHRRLYPQSPLIDARQVAMRSPRATADADLESTDRVLLFTATDCVACDAVLDRLLARLPAVAGIDLYLLDVAAGEEDRIRQWAEKHKIDPQWVHERRITLNVDGGALKQLAATTDQKMEHPPVVLRRRGEVVSPLSLARL